MNVHDLGRTFESYLSNELWPSMGISVVLKRSNKLEQRKYGDFQIHSERYGYRNVDVKAEQDTPPNFPIELLQDWASFDVGWFYTLLACDEIWYGRYVKGELDSVYRVSLRRLRGASSDDSVVWDVRKASKNWGDTIIVTAPLFKLCEAGIAEQIAL